MYLQEIKHQKRMGPLKFSLGEMPHATLEINRTCNLRCRACYNLYREGTKDKAEVKKEIDLLLEKRNLQVITVLGGEPTLHPDLPEIIAYIKTKRILCQLLTNGLVFLESQNDRLLDGLKSAGIDKILFHVDEGQHHVHADIEMSRRVLFSKCERRKINFSLSLTVYDDTVGQIPALIKKYAKYRYFDGVLAVLARDSHSPQAKDPQLLDEYQSLLAELELEPVAYIPSHGDDHYLAWLIYYFFINACTGKTVGLSPLLNRVFRKLYRYIKRRNFFVIKFTPAVIGLLILAVGAGEIVLRPKKLVGYWGVLRKSSFLKSLRFHYIAIQTPPEISQPQEQIKICFHCPDATIRNGKLTALCVADRINPLGGNLPKDVFREDLYRLVNGHLGEL